MKKRNMIIIFAGIIIVSIFLILRFGGEILVSEDKIENKEDALIVLLMGSTGDRALGAADLYKDGKGAGILMVHSYIAGIEPLEERRITIPGNADISKDVLIELGVPEERITILPGDAESTKDEALVLADYLEDNPEIDQLVLVTSKFHSYRSKLIFNKALAHTDVEVYSAPTAYDRFEARGWYRDREDIQSVVTEYIKLAHFLLLEQFQVRKE